MKKILLLSFFFLLIVSESFSQSAYFDSALKFSQISFGGTARFTGIGGATTALGGDISSANNNPAGLGFISSSSFSITPLIGINTTRTDLFQQNQLANQSPKLLGGNTSDSRTIVGISHLGLVISKAEETSGSSFYGGSFAISVTRVKDFNNSFTYSGKSDVSLIDYLLETSNNNYSWAELDNQGVDGIYSLEALGYFTYLINPYTEDYTYFPIVPKEELLIEEEVVTKGAQYEWNFAYGGNLADKFYFGGSLGVNTINYELNKTYTETVIAPTEDNPLKSLKLENQLSIKGFGANFRLGIIYRINDYVRLGISGVTPTFISLSEGYSENLTVNYDPSFIFIESDYLEGTDVSDEPIRLGTQSAETLILEQQYILRTPARLNIGLSTFIGKKGFLSADIEFVSYGKAKLSGNIEDFSFDTDNQVISETYSSVYNLKIGGELRLKKYRLQMGFAHYASPYKQEDFDSSQQFITLGFGKRKENRYSNFGLIINTFKSSYLPYRLSDNSQPFSVTDNTAIKATFSIGTFF